MKININSLIYSISGVVGAVFLFYLQGEYFDAAQIVQINYGIFVSSFVSSCLIIPLATGLQNQYYDFINGRQTYDPFRDSVYDVCLLIFLVSLISGIFVHTISHEFLSPGVIVFLFVVSTFLGLISDYFYVSERYRLCLLVGFFSPFVRVFCALLLGWSFFGVIDDWFSLSYYLALLVFVIMVLRFSQIFKLISTVIWPRRWLILGGGLGIFTSFQDRLIYGFYSDTEVLSALLIIGSGANLISMAERYLNFCFGRDIGIKVRFQSKNEFVQFLDDIGKIILKLLLVGLLLIVPACFGAPFMISVFGFEFQSVLSHYDLVCVSFIYLLGSLLNLARAPLILIATAKDSGKQILYSDVLACLGSISIFVIGSGFDFPGHLVVSSSFLTVCMVRILVIWVLLRVR